jgi:hypothetical protein
MSNIQHYCQECKGTLFTIVEEGDYGLKVPECMQCGSRKKPHERIVFPDGTIKTGIRRKKLSADFNGDDSDWRNEEPVERRLKNLREDWLLKWYRLTLTRRN